MYELLAVFLLLRHPHYMHLRNTFSALQGVAWCRHSSSCKNSLFEKTVEDWKQVEEGTNNNVRAVASLGGGEEVVCPGW